MKGKTKKKLNCIERLSQLKFKIANNLICSTFSSTNTKWFPFSSFIESLHPLFPLHLLLLLLLLQLFPHAYPFFHPTFTLKMAETSTLKLKSIATSDSQMNSLPANRIDKNDKKVNSEQEWKSRFPLKKTFNILFNHVTW